MATVERRCGLDQRANVVAFRLGADHVGDYELLVGQTSKLQPDCPVRLLGDTRRQVPMAHPFDAGRYLDSVDELAGPPPFALEHAAAARYGPLLILARDRVLGQVRD